MLKKLTAISLLFVGVGLSGCAPRAVPFGGSVHWGLKGGLYWTWDRQLDHGCGAWMAKDGWAAVQLVVDSQCDERDELGSLNGAGISYQSDSDEIVFRGYWPQDDFIGGDPCPHTVSETQITQLRSLAAEALAQATTAGERRVLHRIDERLSVANGSALMTHHGGLCSDLTQEDWNAAGARIKQDAWQGGR